LAALHRWILVLARVLATQGRCGVMVVVHPWILVLAGVLASGVDGELWL